MFFELSFGTWFYADWGWQRDRPKPILALKIDDGRALQFTKEGVGIISPAPETDVVLAEVEEIRWRVTNKLVNMVKND